MYFEETYQTDEISAVRLEDSRLVAHFRWSPETSSVLCVTVVRLQACSNDRKLEKVKSVQTSLVAHVGSKIKVIGHLTIRVWRNKVSFLLGCRLIESREIFPILERKACLGMKIIQYNDNDQPHKPQTEGAAVYNADSNLGSVLTRKGNTGEVANSAR